MGEALTTVPPEHGFTRVDDDVRPRAWVECLDRLHAEPFYREYKARVRAILDPWPAGRYLEIGSGVGTDALAVRAAVIGVDRSLTMARESRARGLRLALVADAHALPLATASVDGCWADRTFQHLVDPARALAEMVRVLEVGGTIVIVDPDYGTQEMEFPDQHLARKVLDYRAHRALRNGTLAHGMAGRFVDGGLGDVSVEEKILVVRDPRSVDHVMGLRSWARAAMAHGTMTGDEVDRWETLYDETVARGAFRWSVAFFITSGRKRTL